MKKIVEAAAPQGHYSAEVGGRGAHFDNPSSKRGFLYPGGMRSGWVLLAAALVSLLAGCPDSSGVIIRVHAPSGATQPTHVRLLIGLDQLFGHETRSISPALGHNAPPDPAATRFRENAAVWQREAARDTLPISPGEPASFVLRPSADHDQLGAVIAVGYVDRGSGDLLEPPLWAAAVFEPALDAGAYTVYELHLRPVVDPSDPDAPIDADDQLQLWGPDQMCVYYGTNGETGSAPDVDHHEAFLIPSDADRDCDGFDDHFHEGGARECLDDVHLGQRRPTNDELSCTRFVPLMDTSLSACVLGGPRCVDGVPPALDECEQSTYCAPRNLCEACLGTADQGACLRDVTRADVPVVEIPRIICTISTTWTSPSMTAFELCPGTSDPVPLIPSLIPQGFACKEAEIADSAGQFRSSISEDTSAQDPDAVLDPDVRSDCQLTVEVSGVIDGGVEQLRPATSLLTIEMEPPGTRDLAVPITFLFEEPRPSCPNGVAITCKLEPFVSDDSLEQCLKLELPPL